MPITILRFQITPSEIESFIESIEGVEIVCVVGIADEKVSNLPAAVVVRKKDATSLKDHEIQSRVAEHFPFYKQLYGGVYFIDEMPMSVNGKISRRIVREFATNKYQERQRS